MVNQASAAMYSSGDGSLTTMPFCPALITGTVGASQDQSRPSGAPATAIAAVTDTATSTVRPSGRRRGRGGAQPSASTGPPYG
ncbi:hypothetical protein GCM10020358_10250 [Amorphoplanes nipponensis]|uniref:hypothetical protein n=1 Tax=Actinoplanes nipponensis TaxID=135950 RepID=UPI0031EA4E82